MLPASTHSDQRAQRLVMTAHEELTRGMPDLYNRRAQNYYSFWHSGVGNRTPSVWMDRCIAAAMIYALLNCSSAAYILPDSGLVHLQDEPGRR